MNIKTEWHPDKAKINFQKHGVRFEEAATAFDDPLYITFLDIEHSLEEERYITIGMSRDNRLLLIAHTERKGITRIISARKATKRERKFYEESE